MSTSSEPHHMGSSSSSKPPRILACVLCQHRKIKCDRHFPCQNCTKANVKCTPSTPAPARKRRRPNQDLQERLARCEELLKEYATDPPAKPDSPSPAANTGNRMSVTPALEDPYPKWQPAGKLVKDDGTMRFMDSFLLGTIYEELRAMKDIVDADDNDDPSVEGTSPDDNSDLLMGDEPAADKAADPWPNPGHAFRLWQTYLDRVNPLTKIIHVPTLQPYLVEATSGSNSIPKNIESLFFSIFLMAVVALNPEECQVMLGCSRESALHRFSSGVRRRLHDIGFLKSHDMATLQSLVIYLLSLQGRYNRHAAWILNGVVIRIAQKMGLHRDGELLGLGPFESEMRRRTWWQIIMLDAKYAMLSGLSHSLLPSSWDAKEPKNCNDADLYPTATEPFQDRDGPTEMIFCLFLCKLAKFMMHVPGIEAMAMSKDIHNIVSVPDATVAEFRAQLQTLGADLNELLDKYCDPTAGPVHRMTLDVRAQVFEKLQDLARPTPTNPEWESEIRTVKDNAFKVALQTLEHNEMSIHQSKEQGFWWFTKLHFQVDVFMYMVGQLCRRPEGNMVARAWKQVEASYGTHPELFDISNKTNYTIAVFVLKGWHTREDYFRARGQPLEVPSYIERLRAVIPEDYLAEPTPTLASPPPLSLRYGPPPDSLVPQDPSVDQILGSYLDVSALDWDMFGNTVVGGMTNNMAPYHMNGAPTQVHPDYSLGMGPNPPRW